ncbi:uncharacterized protein [Musca autumnalis]|uniref:uncharacterized protein n=1 Tax=Musca autumnalis TaxID=221902 RepID=UPI003CEDD55E
MPSNLSFNVFLVNIPMSNSFRLTECCYDIVATEVNSLYRSLQARFLGNFFNIRYAPKLQRQRVQITKMPHTAYKNSYKTAHKICTKTASNTYKKTNTTLATNIRFGWRNFKRLKTH